MPTRVVRNELESSGARVAGGRRPLS
ncbi:hypothetical protein IEO21_02810 [Rhodonia placenta]|uniref:Uncharacterized protein n=1 Tax=Rhodonia placenta TaxID=104341 RepID=A0A8H7P712_9APHY|nr:hypothetical protein IEO21_02810 [Postia placenta]